MDSGELRVTLDVKTRNTAAFEAEYMFDRFIDQELTLKIVDGLVYLDDHRTIRCFADAHGFDMGIDH